MTVSAALLCGHSIKLCIYVCTVCVCVCRMDVGLMPSNFESEYTKVSFNWISTPCHHYRVILKKSCSTVVVRTKRPLGVCLIQK